MTAHGQLDNFLTFLRRRFPAAGVETDGHGDPNASTWINVRLNGQLFVVQWRAGQGFGIWKPSADARSAYGEGPDEHYRSYPAARRRMEQLLTAAAAAGDQPPARPAKRAAGG